MKKSHFTEYISFSSGMILLGLVLNFPIEIIVLSTGLTLFFVWIMVKLGDG